MRILAFFFVLIGAFGCANRAAIYTETGIRAAEKSWDGAYRERADQCEHLHEPRTPAMEECFGDYFDADAKVGTALESVVAILRGYWVARAAGEKPDWKEVIRQVQEIMDELPPEAKEYFERVKGLK